jgi:predicted methyltransferase MtxX (methanogen marker protein 4)
MTKLLARRLQSRLRASLSERRMVIRVKIGIGMRRTSRRCWVYL